MKQRLIDAEALKKEVENLVAGGAERLKDYYENGSKKEENEWIGGVYDAYELIDDAPTVEYPFYAEAYQTGYEEGMNDARPTDNPVIKCKDCKYQIKEWREDRRMKEKGYWSYGCKYFGELMGYWGFGGNDNEFCSEAEQRDEQEADE